LIETGLVKKVHKDDMVSVAINYVASSACSTCPMKSICVTSSRVIEARNKIGANINDQVKVKIPDRIGWNTVVVNFTIPVILLIVGVIFGTILFHKDIYGFIGGLGLLSIYFIILIPIERRHRKSANIPEIIEIIKK